MGLASWCGERAAFVVRDAEGLERFACAAHATGGELTPVVDWFEAAGLPVPYDEGQE